jgi:hypothetical protein
MPLAGQGKEEFETLDHRRALIVFIPVPAFGAFETWMGTGILARDQAPSIAGTALYWRGIQPRRPL